MKKNQKNSDNHNDNDKIKGYNSVFKYLLSLLLLLLSEALTNISKIYFKTVNIFGP